MMTIGYKNGKHIILDSDGTSVMEYGTERKIPNPKELLEAALGHCSALSLEGVLKRDGLLSDDTEFNVEVESFGDESGKNRLGSFKIKIDFPEGLDEKYKKKALVIVGRACTIGNTLREGSSVELSY